MAAEVSKQPGDLTVLTVVEHINDPKKFAIMGKFKGYRKQIILARIGEGDDDPRTPETIKTTAESVAKEIQSLYSIDAFIRHREHKKTASTEKVAD
ncbi:hypothetical protein GOB57_08135 [Sinorhizobium meliloti]|nr:hypothetical protein [Sinorhizobium meliloti]